MSIPHEKEEEPIYDVTTENQNTMSIDRYKNQSNASIDGYELKNQNNASIDGYELIMNAIT